MLIQENISLSSFCWFKVGGFARYYYAPKSVKDFQESIQWAYQKNISTFILGNGSNVIFSDAGFQGLVIHTQPHFTKFEFNEEEVVCDSGSLIYKISQGCIKKGLGGIEQLVGIPGTIGGAVYTNAGAYEQEIGDTLVSVTSCTYKGEIIERSLSECQMNYRNSIFTSLSESILKVSLKLELNFVEKLQKEMKKSFIHRKRTQPLQFPNVGSIFKKYKGISAGKLIEEGGLKEVQIGGAQVSLKHANFIINKGNATAQDVYDLTYFVQKKIFEKERISLELEVRFAGDFVKKP